MGNKQQQFKKKSSSLDFSNSIIFNTKTKNPEEEYENIKKLDSGYFGEIFLAKHKKTGFFYVIKKIKKNSENELTVSEIKNEINILKGIEHPNIIKIHGFYATKEIYYLVLEYCEKGNLYNFIGLNKLTEKQIAYIMYQIFLAVNYCHNMNILHRDLKPDNILIKSYKNDICHIKICDFGTAKIFRKKEVQKELLGTPPYIAPEVIKGKYNEKCDLWSCGVIFYILLTGCNPFISKDDEETFEKILENNVNIDNYNYSDNTKDLIKKLLEKNPKKRINAEEALNHNLFKYYQIEQLYKINDKNIINHYISNLKNYKCDSIIQRTAIAFLIHNFDIYGEAQELSYFFKSINTQNKGIINRKELRIGLSEIIESKELDNIVNDIFNKVDTDNDGTISYEEFLRAGIDKKIFLDDKALKFAYDYFDRKNEGIIHINDLKEFFKKHLKNKENSKDLEDLEKMIDEIDENKNGIFEFNEFKDLMLNLVQ